MIYWADVHVSRFWLYSIQLCCLVDYYYVQWFVWYGRVNYSVCMYLMLRWMDLYIICLVNYYLLHLFSNNVAVCMCVCIENYCCHAAWTTEARSSNCSQQFNIYYFICFHVCCSNIISKQWLLFIVDVFCCIGQRVYMKRLGARTRW